MIAAVFHAAEGQFARGARGAVVPVDAASLALAEESFEVILACGEDRCRQSVARRVGLLDRLIQIINDRNLRERTEDFAVVLECESLDFDDAGGDEMPRPLLHS